DALDDTGIKVPGVGAFECAKNVAGGRDVQREMTYGPAAEHADIISENRQRRQHDHHRDKARDDEVADRIDGHHFKRFDFFRDFHRAQFGGDSGAASADHDHRDQD